MSIKSYVLAVATVAAFFQTAPSFAQVVPYWQFDCRTHVDARTGKTWRGQCGAQPSTRYRDAGDPDASVAGGSGFAGGVASASAGRNGGRDVETTGSVAASSPSSSGSFGGGSVAASPPSSSGSLGGVSDAASGERGQSGTGSTGTGSETVASANPGTPAGDTAPGSSPDNGGGSRGGNGGNGGPKGNNGFGNGDQDAPGGSGGHNNAENAQGNSGSGGGQGGGNGNGNGNH